MKPTKLLLTLPLLACSTTLMAKQKQPNIIIIMSDDQGYQDLSCYDSPLIKTPVIDKMASEGLRLTDFYQSASVSSASRAGLLTGRLNSRNGVPKVYFPNENGIPTEEITIAEMLRESGYATACFGKWHLGDAEECMPLSKGFDEYFGIPYSNDMYISPLIPISENINFRDGYTMEIAVEEQKISAKGRGIAIKNKLRYKSPLVEGGEVIEFPCDQATLTRRYFDRAIEFVKKNKNQPFFTYITPAMPHDPLFASDQFLGTSERGLYGDCVEEIDWNIGRLLETLEEEGLLENTIIVFTSDNGPSLAHGEGGGSALPLRDGKFKHYEGGVRVPFIIKWDGTIPAGVVSDAVVRSIDLFPTIMHYAGVKSITHHLDGKNISIFLENPKKCKGLDEYVYVKDGNIVGVRKGDWIYLPYSGSVLMDGKGEAELFNIKENIAEDENLIESNPKILAEMKALFEAHLADNQQ
ncbi:MAG: sulfatase-like hydrolase/transferase [Rikenellaceae bacterium]